MNDSQPGYPIPTIPEYALPAFAKSTEDRERWQLANAVAAKISSQNEPDGRPNSMFVFHFARSVYFSDLPTGTADDAPCPVDLLDL